MTTRWYLGGVAAGAAIGWVAAMCHFCGWAPIGLVSLGVGLALGYILSKLSAATGVCCPQRIVVGTVIFAVVAVFAEHAWLYHDFRRQWVDARANDPQVALFRPAEPWSPTVYFRHEMSSGRIALWLMDAALIVTGAVGAVLLKRGAKTKNFVVADDANNPVH